MEQESSSRTTPSRPVEEEPLPADHVRRRPLVAAILSLLVTGGGQLYNGAWGKAAAFYLGACVVGELWLSGMTGRVFWGLVVTVVALLVLKIWSIADAAVVARRSRAVRRHLFARWWLLAPAVVGLALLPLAFVPLQAVQSYYLPSASMEPTLAVGDRVIADLGYFDEHPLEVGTVLIFRSPENPVVELAKRVAALPGDRVEIRDKAFFVNGKPAQEPWAVHRDGAPARVSSPALRLRDNLGPVVVPKDAFFALGDNRDFSYDSRFFGPVPLANLRGKLLFVYWSADRRRIGRAIE